MIQSVHLCAFAEKTVHKTKITLRYPNLAIDEDGNTGRWTLIYNQGFEAVIQYRKYFAFFAYKVHGGDVESYCDRTLVGWSHDVLGKNWACYRAKKQSPVPVKVHELPRIHNSAFRQDKDLIKSINEANVGWTATHYSQFEGKSRQEIVSMAGGLKSILPRYVTTF